MTILDFFKKKEELTREELRGKALEAKLEMDELKEDEKAKKAIQDLEDFKNKDKQPSKLAKALKGLDKVSEFANQFDKPKKKGKGMFDI